MKSLLEIKNLHLSVDQAQKELVITNIMNSIQLRLDKPVSAGLLSKLKNILLKKPLNNLALCGLVSVMVITPSLSQSIQEGSGFNAGSVINPIIESTNPGGSTNPGDSIITIPGVTNPGNTGSQQPGSPVIEAKASSKIISGKLNATITIKDEFIPTEGNVISLFNGDDFIDFIDSDSLVENEFTIKGLLPNTTYNSFNIRVDADSIPEVGYVSVIEKRINILLGEGNSEDVSVNEVDIIPLGTIETEEDPELEAAIQEALDREVLEGHEDEASDFDENKVYKQGDKILFNDNEYRALWYTIKDNPEESIAWEKISKTVTDSGFESFDTSKVYYTGNKVEFEGSIYSARWWTRGQVPSELGNWQHESSVDGAEIDLSYKAGNIYNRGDIVVIDDVVYEAKWWNQNVNPAGSDAWKIIKQSVEDDSNVLWDANTQYEAGDIVEYDGILYIAFYWTEGRVPSDLEGWNLYHDGEENETIKEFNENNIYKKGESVIFDGNIFTAKWVTPKGAEPDIEDPYGAWEFIQSVKS